MTNSDYRTDTRVQPLAHLRTVIVQGRLATREHRHRAAKAGTVGLRILTFEQLAARLAGGLMRPLDDDALRGAVQAALPVTDLGELEPIKTLPGMVNAAAGSLAQCWRANIDLSAIAGQHARLAAIARLEQAVAARLPPDTAPPPVIVQLAMERVVHAERLLGPIEIVGVRDLAPVWRSLLHDLARHVPVVWRAGPMPTPDWLDTERIVIETAPATAPTISVDNAATAKHEAIEAMRWARALMASGVRPEAIAITAASSSDYDDHFLALRDEANLPLHFPHGLPALSTRDGQTAAALADIVLRGLSQTRLRRLVRALGRESGPFAQFPERWLRVLPADAPLISKDSWARLFQRLEAADWPDGQDHGPALRTIVDLLRLGAEAAREIGEALLSGRPLALWRKALIAGPAASLGTTLEGLRVDDGLDPSNSVVFCAAGALAAAPRAHVRLLGLNSSRWPRRDREDRLISDHIVATRLLDPIPIGEADRRDFATILATAEQVTLSFARRGDDGRILGRSPLLRSVENERYLRRNRVPVSAFSEGDRLAARREEFETTPQAMSAQACWRAWNSPAITPHDGLLRPGHPVIAEILARPQSASSLRLLLRYPLAFVWRYGLGLYAPEMGEEPLTLDPRAKGDLAHMILDAALRRLESDGGLLSADDAQIRDAMIMATRECAERWETERPTPPGVIWRRTLNEAEELGTAALGAREAGFGAGRAFAEVPFGGEPPRPGAELPWDAAAEVVIPGAELRIKGRIDRLDLSEDGARALVRDYKTGKPPEKIPQLAGGAELQRCLYGYAVKALLGTDIQIDASLLYLRDGRDLRLENADDTLERLSAYLATARTSLENGAALAGPDAGGDYDDFALALPANAGAVWRPRKEEATLTRLGQAARIWEEP